MPHLHLQELGLVSGHARVRIPLLVSFPAALPAPGRARPDGAAVTAPAKATRCPRVATACPHQLRPARCPLRLTKIAQLYVISYENKSFCKNIPDIRRRALTGAKVVSRAGLCLGVVENYFKAPMFKAVCLGFETKLQGGNTPE